MFSRPTQVPTSFRFVTLVLGLSAISGPVKAGTVTCDTPPSPSSVALNEARFQGFTFTSVDGFNHVDSGTFSAAVSNNGTSFLVVSPSATGALSMSTNGQPFSLTAFDLDTFVHIQGTATVTLTGVFSSGFAISQRFVTDAIGDGPGPLADFQRFSPIGFTDLVSLQFSSSDHCIRARQSRYHCPLTRH